LISNSTPIVGRADGGQKLNTGGPVPSSFVFGKDANSEQSHRFKKMMEKARPSTPLGGSY
jgi:hypothetical protein|tara:strand:- start:10043 stop:10222 length:180 start_codon:yes stop_codon:yes gene_type:complete